MYDGLLKNLDFELIIAKQKNGRFKATSPLFPHCKGFGGTKKEAITTLCSSIANYLKRSTFDFLKLHLLSNNYTEVITDPHGNDDFQHRIVSISSQSQVVDYRVYLKSISSVLNSRSVSQGHSNLLFDSFSIQDVANDHNSPENDDLILGINVCLN